MNAEEKYTALKEILGNLKNVVLAFSGGMDSTLLLKVSVDVLGKKNVVAVTGKAPIFPAKAIDEARLIARRTGAEHLIVETSVLEIGRFLENSADRCYYCKRNLFGILLNLAGNKKTTVVIQGTNFDDLDDFRPGERAAQEMGIVSPLLLAKLTKDDIRYLSKKLDLPTWNKPPDACLATRIPYGTKIETGLLERIEHAEEFIGQMGVLNVRVRYHGRIARIELPEADIERIISGKEKIVKGLKDLGFSYVTLDLEGYRTGSLNIETGDG